MKKISHLIAALTLLAGTSQAQSPYSFTYTTGTYVPLANATSINNGQVWSNQPFQVPIGFNFYFHDQTYTSLYVSGGNIAFELSPKKAFTVLNFSTDRGTTTSLSPVSYTLTGNPGSRILRIEWSNAGYYGYAQDHANAQVWLYEEGSCLEVHVGPNAVCCADSYDYPFTDATGEYIGVYTEDGNGGAVLYSIEGPPASPVLSTDEMNYHGMTGTPPDGSIYKFCPTITSGINEPGGNIISMYPNPVTDIMTISTGEKIENINVFDPTGRLVITQDGPVPSVDLSGLQNGMYLVKVQTAGGVITKKIFKE